MSGRLPVRDAWHRADVADRARWTRAYLSASACLLTCVVRRRHCRLTYPVRFPEEVLLEPDLHDVCVRPDLLAHDHSLSYARRYCAREVATRGESPSALRTIVTTRHPAVGLMLGIAARTRACLMKGDGDGAPWSSCGRTR